jgi:hypothetical protein
MKTILLALTLVALSLTVSKAGSAIPTRLGLAPLPASFAATARHPGVALPKLTLAPLPGTATSNLPSNPSEFAQLGAQNRSLPISSGMVLALVALFVLAMRIMGLNHARAMADHERDSHHGKAQMFRSLQEERSER